LINGLTRLCEAGFCPASILDIGAYEGHWARDARRVWRDAYILMVEALPEKSPVLQQTCEELGNADYVTALLGNTEQEEVPFFVVDTNARPDLIRSGSSKYREDTSFPMKTMMLPQYTLDSVTNGKPFQLLKLDVQGAELEILQGFHHVAQVEVVLMEMSLVQYNKDAPLIHTVLDTMRRMGFVLYDIIGEHRFSGRLFQVDGVFVRPTSRYRPQPPFGK